MTAVVTGASGFLGGAVVRQLLHEGYEVRAVDLVEGPTLDGLDVDFVRADILAADSVRAALRDADLVVHLVALISISGDPTGAVRAINVDGARNVAEATRDMGVRRLVHCSSVHAFDLETNGREVDERSPRATAPSLPPYDRSKAAGEAAVREAVGDELELVIVNPTGIIGVYDHEPSRMGHVFRALFNGRLPALIEGGFDWVDSRDVARSMVKAAQQGTTGENYLLPGHHQSMAELAHMCSDVSGVAAPRVNVPLRLARAWGPIGDRLSRRSGSPLTYTSESLHALEHAPPISGEKARLALGHTARPTEDSVADIYEWFKQQGSKERYSSSS